MAANPIVLEDDAYIIGVPSKQDLRHVVKRSPIPQFDQISPLVNEIIPPFDQFPQIPQILPIPQIPPLDQMPIPPIPQTPPIDPNTKLKIFKKLLIKKTPKLLKLGVLFGTGLGLGSLGTIGVAKLMGVLDEKELLGAYITGKKAQFYLLKSMEEKLGEIEKKLEKIEKIEDLLINIIEKKP